MMLKKSADEIAKEFKNRKISFKSDENISIINGYVPDEENQCFYL